MPPPPDSLARRTVAGSAYSALSSAGTIALGLLRTYLMIRFLQPDEIGVAALALITVNFGAQIGAPGFGEAYVQRPNVDEAGRRTFFTFHVLIGSAGLALTAALAPLFAAFYPSYDGLAVLIWAAAAVGLLRTFNQPQASFLEKDLAFGRLAVLDFAGGLAATIVGPGMAYFGFGPWAVIGEFAGGVLARFLLFHFWLTGSRPRFGWDRAAARWLWQFGRTVWTSANLSFLIDHFDDFWVGTVLGKSSLGLYSKAYEFARYPRRVVANPLLAVFFPTFAHVQADRTRLSRAFFRSTSLMVRIGALFSLGIILTAPEVFRLFLPPAWLPMQLTFQLMVLYTFLDPLAVAAQRLLTAAGLPALVTRTRAIQLLVFIPAVALGAALRGIEGVALAADLMVLVGAILLFRVTFRVVDYSPRALWFWPVIALVGLGALFLALQPRLDALGEPAALALKLVAIPALYAAVLWLFERRQLLAGLDMLRGLLPRRRHADPAAGSDSHEE